ncbi:MAG: response regulator [Candidatus Krumholzibacteria bacterium]|nr:response regulator [Candidatus Krumholzibacteria bacterium]
MAGEKILIVDDEKNMCQYLSIMLRKEGYDVKTVHNGKKALQEIKESVFDVVITDIKMEGMDGIELLTAVKESNPTPTISSSARRTTRSRWSSGTPSTCTG